VWYSGPSGAAQYGVHPEHLFLATWSSGGMVVFLTGTKDVRSGVGTVRQSLTPPITKGGSRMVMVMEAHREMRSASPITELLHQISCQ
jgi:hypothetical protein